MKCLLSWCSRLLAHFVFSLSWNWCFNKGLQIPFWMYPILNLQTFQKSKHWSTQQSSPLDTRHCLLTQWITSIHEHKEKHCSSRNRQGSNYLVALETIISLIRGQPRVMSMDACLGESLWYHHGQPMVCIQNGAWLYLCPRRKGTEGDRMPQRKGQQRCWGTDFWLLPLKIKYIDSVCLGWKEQWAAQCLC